MNDRAIEIKENIESVKKCIAKAAQKSGRKSSAITLVAVTKYVTLDDMRYAIEAGIKVVGENKVQDAKKKFFQIGPVVDWHMIGHLQTNKARQAAALFSTIQTVDSLKVVEVLDKEAMRFDRKLNVLIEVNISHDENKFGIHPDETKQLIQAVCEKEHLVPVGLMAMAPYVEDKELTRPFFRVLKQLFDEIKEEMNPGKKWNMLSMGMTNDYEVAIEEGSTLVRIGTGIFQKQSGRR